jgi:hypothetical protein
MNSVSVELGKWMVLEMLRTDTVTYGLQGNIRINNCVHDSSIKIVPENSGHLSSGCRDTYERRAPECGMILLGDLDMGRCQRSVSSSGQFPIRMNPAVSLNSKLSMSSDGLPPYLHRTRSTCALRIGWNGRNLGNSAISNCSSACAQCRKR